MSAAGSAERPHVTAGWLNVTAAWPNGTAGRPNGTTGKPRVTVVIPARNCAHVLQGCLDAISAQTYAGPLDVVIAAAPSTDGAESAAATAQCSWPTRVVDNPAGTTSAGLNAAITASEGAVIVRVDAQSRLPADYVERAVATLARTGAANVGGMQRPVGNDGLSRVIAAAMSSGFGGGPAHFRHGRLEGPVDTVYLGVFDAEALAAVGGFDESLERNQDYELNWRLREQGRFVWLDPGLVVDYLPRSSWSGLARQYYDYGAWKRTVIGRHPRSMRPRQLAAPALVCGLALSAVELIRGRLRGGLVPAAYLGACGVAAARLRRSLPGRADRCRAAAAFVVMHLSWGMGFLAGRRGGR